MSISGTGHEGRKRLGFGAVIRRSAVGLAFAMAVAMLVSVAPTGAQAAPGEERIAACDAQPPQSNVGLTNVGFETGLLGGWTLGTVTEQICVTGADAFTAPYEGSFMARLGRSQTGPAFSQTEGPNELSQTFVVDQPTESFVYNIFTYDYTGYDNFQYSLKVNDAAGAVIASYQRGAWGPSGDTSLKSSGWRYAELDLSNHIGKSVTLSISAGGTRDSQYAFWAYLDSATSGSPPPIAPISSVQTSSGSVTTDQQTGQVTISMPAPSVSDVMITSDVVCPDGNPPTSVTLLLGSQEFAMSETPPGSGTYSATIPASKVKSGALSIVAVCVSGTYVTPVGKITLYDPSGDVTDASTGLPIEGASVTLYKVPGWSPGPGGQAASECQKNGPPWTQPAPTSLGVKVSPYGSDTDGGNPEIEPDVNPFTTNAAGRYGWDVAEGCWYVVVAASGYVTQTSAVVGVPPEVTTLDIALQPGTSPPPPSSSGYTAVGPDRVLDTRTDGGGRVPPGQVEVVPVGSQYAGKSISVNLTVTGALAPGYATLYACDQSRPDTSSLNYRQSQAIANGVITKVSAQGTVCVYVNRWAHVVLDVFGVFPSNSTFSPEGPERVADTRPSSGGIGYGPNFATLRVTVGSEYAGKSISVNLTVTGALGPGYATLYACDQSRPDTSSLNYQQTEAIANGVITKVSAQGTVCVLVSRSAYVVLDLFGVFPSSAALTPVGPDRVLDTRTDGGGRVPAFGTEVVSVGSQYAGQSISVNLTVTGAFAAGFATLYACDQPRPETSSLNYRASQARANGVITKVSAQGTVCVYVNRTSHVILDIFGLFPS